MTAPQSPAARPVTAGMRWILWVAGGLVFVAGFQLFVLTENTDRFFAWTINPPLTAAFLGAAYWSSCVLEYVAARERLWAQARIAVPAVLLFTTLTLVATLLHLDKFHLASPDPVTLGATWAWIAIYASVPALMLVALIFQARAPGGDPPRQRLLPGWMCLVIGLQAAVMLILGLALFFTPEALLLWPWKLTPLTGQAVGAWLLGLGIAAAQVIRENDFERVKTVLATSTVFGVLQFVALARYAGTVNWAGVNTWVYVLFLLSVLAVGGYGSYAAWRAGPRTTTG